MSQKFDITEAKAIVDWVNLNEDIRELSLRFGDLELFITRNEHSSYAPAPALTQTKSISREKVGAEKLSLSESEKYDEVKDLSLDANENNNKEFQIAADEVVVYSPMVGTFYAAPKPGAPAFVEVGDTVTKDTVLCIVEVMKLMNNIEAGVDGVVQKILVKNEEPVEYNQPLMIIKVK